MCTLAVALAPSQAGTLVAAHLTENETQCLQKIQYMFPFVPVHVFLLDTTGVWEDINGNDRPDAGETFSLNVTVANTGTVTLDAISVSDSINSAGCTSAAPFRLAQGELRECIAVLEVSTRTQQILVADHVNMLYGRCDRS